jgi:sodium-dependent dicarboxylate transporter 2/3/5
MMPIATPPNALVFASGYIRVAEMARAGIWMNILALALIGFLLVWTIPLFFPN